MMLTGFIFFSPYFCEKSPFMIQESEVGIPLQIFKDQCTEEMDLKIVDRTFSKLSRQSDDSKYFERVF